MRDETAHNASAQYLKTSRKAAGLTTQDAAKRIGVSVSTIGRWEREGVTKKVGCNVFAKICNTYGISADDLCSLIDQRPTGTHTPHTNQGATLEASLEPNGLSKDETMLLRAYRSADARGRNLIITAAELGTGWKEGSAFHVVSGGRRD